MSDFEIDEFDSADAREFKRLRQQLKDARDELSVYRLASERAIYDAQQFDPSLYLNTDRGVEDVMRRVLARLGEYEGENKRLHAFETVKEIAARKRKIKRNRWDNYIRPVRYCACGKALGDARSKRCRACENARRGAGAQVGARG